MTSSRSTWSTPRSWTTTRTRAASDGRRPSRRRDGRHGRREGAGGAGDLPGPPQGGTRRLGEVRTAAGTPPGTGLPSSGPGRADTDPVAGPADGVDLRSRSSPPRSLSAPRTRSASPPSTRNYRRRADWDREVSCFAAKVSFRRRPADRARRL
ncbi:hypothetical protein HBB16_05610 [Pseudonocardia sp. MCCB 268]|nr:hypothetical protein [Pseudonocardia cytotoxica]